MKTAFRTTIAVFVAMCVTIYAEFPGVKEFGDGHTTKFSTTGHAKAKGLKMTIRYPNSWVAKEGEHPNIVQKFISNGGHGVATVLITTKTLPLPPGSNLTEKELTDFFSPSELKNTVPEGAKFIAAKTTKIEALPAGMVEYTKRVERAGMTTDQHTIMFLFVYGSTMVSLQCTVTRASPTPPAIMAQGMAEFMAVFTLMANSIILEDKWK